MTIRERWGDPKIEENITEADEYIESQIVIDGQLTEYGERLYEESREYFYDEKTQEWIQV